MIYLTDIAVCEVDNYGKRQINRHWLIVEKIVTLLSGRHTLNSYQDDVNFLRQHGINLMDTISGSTTHIVFTDMKNVAFVFDTEEEEMLFRLKYL